MKELPIHAVMAKLCAALAEHDNAVLSAPPGAGKTTQVPLSLIQQPWCTGKVVMFEPRRMAARAAATRMAQLLDEPVGQTVGYRIRGESKVCARTRIEVVTGGVLSRMLVEDPSLDGYSSVVLDEFHERNLDADLSLALTLTGRALFRTEPLKLLVMSATLEASAIVSLLDNAPYIVSEGKMHPVDIVHVGQTTQQDLANNITQTVLNACTKHQGHILVFLPGQKDIHTVHNALRTQVNNTTCILPLYGNQSLEQQQEAISPLASNSPYTQKIVLATDIAETSLTIDGVTVVVDGGFHKAPVFDARTSMTRLETRRISKASAVQRAGRAGRTAPGTCYRLWAKEQVLAQHGEAEITQADLAPLVLSLFAFGISHPNELTWLTPPPEKSYQHAFNLLAQLGAIEPKTNTLTAHGQQLMRLPTHPRLGHMMLQAQTYRLEDEATTLSALISETHNLIQTDNLDHALEALKSPTHWPYNVRNAKQQFLKQLPTPLKQARTLTNTGNTAAAEAKTRQYPLGVLLAMAYPDRIAQQTQTPNIYRLSNGRQARIRPNSSLQKHAWLAVAELGGAQGKTEDIIYSAAPINEATLHNHLAALIKTKNIGLWCQTQNRFIAEEVKSIGANIISRAPNNTLSKAERTRAILEFIQQKKLDVLTWGSEETSLCARVNCLKNNAADALPKNTTLPDMSIEALTRNAETWLEPFLSTATTLNHLKKINVLEALNTLLPWPLPKVLDEYAPTHFKVPSGSNIRIDYSVHPPVLAVKLQEMFGSKKTPSIANGAIALTVHLLSPAGRPLQITQDLTGFWATSYHDVKKDMKGRYPKHPWPEDPTNATATRFTKKRFEENKNK